MMARLTAIGIESQAAAAPGHGISTELETSLAEQLGMVELYSILSPLEHMFQRSASNVRVAVVRALSRFLYKRTFITLRDALADSDPAVVAEAAKALEELRFPHAFDPLARIYRESQSPSVRASAVRALAKIDTFEAAEMLLGIIQHDGQRERMAAVEALKRTRGLKFVDLAKSAQPHLAGPAQAAVREVLFSRGLL